MAFHPKSKPLDFGHVKELTKELMKVKIVATVARTHARTHARTPRTVETVVAVMCSRWLGSLPPLSVELQQQAGGFNSV